MEYNIENEERILIQGKGNYCSKLKKGKLKTKKLLKITRYIRWPRAASTISRASSKLRKYVFTKTWNVVVTTSISENKYVPCQKEKFQATIIAESSHVQWSFIQQKVHLCLRPWSLDNTLNRPSCTWESFNIRQKIGLFVLGVTYILNIPAVCVKLMRVGRQV